MDKLEELYRKAAEESTVENYYPEYKYYLSEDLFIDKSKEITTDIAVKFLEWYETSEFVSKYQRQNKVFPTMDGSHILEIQEQREKLFEEFINNHYEKNNL